MKLSSVALGLFFLKLLLADALLAYTILLLLLDACEER